MKKALTSIGTQTKVVALRLGFLAGANGEEVKVDFSLHTASSVMLESVYVRGREKSTAVMAYTFDLVVSFPFITLLFAVIYKFVSDVRIAWRDVWIGATTTSLLYSVGKFLTDFYLGPSTVTSIYGAAGSLVTLLLWVYYSSLMFFFGAELT